MPEDPFSPETERAFVRDVVAGVQAAMEKLGERLRCISRFLVAIDRQAGRRLPPETLEDLGQEVAVVVLERIHEFRALAPLEAWVHRIARLCYMNALRSRRRDAERFRALDEAGPIVDDPRLADLERQDLVLQGLERLGGIEAEIIWARHFAGLDFAVIGARLGVKPATVKTRYYRGLERLERLLVASGEVGRG